MSAAGTNKEAAQVKETVGSGCREKAGPTAFANRRDGHAAVGGRVSQGMGSLATDSTKLASSETGSHE